jgi:hypothetical protein
MSEEGQMSEVRDQKSAKKKIWDTDYSVAEAMARQGGRKTKHSQPFGQLILLRGGLHILGVFESWWFTLMHL